LTYDILTTIILKIFDIQDLSIGVIVPSCDCGIARVCDVYDVKTLPTGLIGICLIIRTRRLSNLNFCIAWFGQLIITDKLDIICPKLMLGCISMIMALILKQWINHIVQIDFVIGIIISRPII